jgi:hypothetical protein
MQFRIARAKKQRMKILNLTKKTRNSVLSFNSKSVYASTLRCYACYDISTLPTLLNELLHTILQLYDYIASTINKYMLSTSGILLTGENKNTRVKKPVQLPLFPQKIQNGLTCD